MLNWLAWMFVTSSIILLVALIVQNARGMPGNFLIMFTKKKSLFTSETKLRRKYSSDTIAVLERIKRSRSLAYSWMHDRGRNGSNNDGCPCEMCLNPLGILNQKTKQVTPPYACYRSKEDVYWSRKLSKSPLNRKQKINLQSSENSRIVENSDAGLSAHYPGLVLNKGRSILSNNGIGLRTDKKSSRKSGTSSMRKFTRKKTKKISKERPIGKLDTICEAREESEECSVDVTRITLDH